MQSLYTRDTLESLFREKKPDIAQSSITTYTNNILRIQRELGQPTDEELETWLDGMKPTQARNLMTPLVILYGARQQIRRLFEKYNSQADSQLDQQRLSASEMKHWVQKKSIKRMLARLREDCQTHKVFAGISTEAKWRLRQMYVLWSVHFEFPWRNILNSCKIAQKAADVDTTSNFYCIREQSFYISVFKTRNVFRRHDYTLPLVHRVTGNLARLIQKHISNRDKYLFCNIRGQPLSKNGYSNLLTGATKKYLAKRVGSTLWRHIWLTDWSRSHRSLKERRAAAFRFHQVSLVTQMRYERPDAPI
jgi:hypothetical protein